MQVMEVKFSVLKEFSLASSLTFIPWPWKRETARPSNQQRRHDLGQSNLFKRDLFQVLTQRMVSQVLSGFILKLWTESHAVPGFYLRKRSLSLLLLSSFFFSILSLCTWQSFSYHSRDFTFLWHSSTVPGLNTRSYIRNLSSCPRVSRESYR